MFVSFLDEPSGIAERQRERWNQVEPRCAERWHLCDDEQFDIAAWFHKHSDRYSIKGSGRFLSLNNCKKLGGCRDSKAVKVVKVKMVKMSLG